MNKKKIKETYLKKISEINQHNKAYYNKNNPIITDADYDKLKKEILDYENKYEFLDNKLSPSKTVGFKPSKVFKKVKHKVPMLSLSKKNKKLFRFKN